MVFGLLDFTTYCLQSPDVNLGLSFNPVVWGGLEWGQAHSIAHLCVSISFPLTPMAYILVFLSNLATVFIICLPAQALAKNTTLEAFAWSSGKNHAFYAK